MSNKGKLYLIPNGLGGDNLDLQIPSDIAQLLENLDLCFVEHPKVARRLIVGMGMKEILDGLEMISFKQGLDKELRILIGQSLENGKNVGIISDAGLPAIADPGNDIVKIAHHVGAQVVPLSGPSSILLSLMASGFNGQNFSFHGYLPKEQDRRKRVLKNLEDETWKNDRTQIFIETPYRNQHLFADILSQCQKKTKICLAVNLTFPDEQITVLTVEQWAKRKIDLQKKQCIFLMYK